MAPTAPPERPTASGEAPAVFRLDPLELRLRGGGVLVGAALLVVLLVVTFQGGAKYGYSVAQAPETAESGAGLRDDELFAAGPEDTEIIPAESPTNETRLIPSNGAGGAAAPTPGAPAQPPRVELKSGYHYIFVQHFPRSAAGDANLVARYLTAEGVPCGIRRDKDIVVVATEAYLIEQSDTAAAKRERTRAEAMLARIKTLGKAYAQNGYTFEGARLRLIR